MPTSQIAASSDEMAWRERERESLSFDNAQRKSDRALGGEDF